MIELSMREMMHRGVHFGHKKQYWNPEMEPYIFGVYQKLHIINLELTRPMLMNAVRFIEQVIQKKGKIVFVGTKYAAQSVVIQEALRCGMPYVDRRWLGGTLTNFKTIRRSVKRLKELEMQDGLSAFEGMTKKERLVLQREENKLSDQVGGIKDMDSLPSALFVLDVGQDAIAVKEANKLGIPVVGVVDTNNSPSGIDYVVPGNDDAMSALSFYTTLVADVIVRTKLKVLAEEKLAAERIQVEVVGSSEKKPVVRNAIKRSAEQASSTKTAGVSNKKRPPSTEKAQAPASEKAAEVAPEAELAKKRPSVHAEKPVQQPKKAASKKGPAKGVDKGSE